MVGKGFVVVVIIVCVFVIVVFCIINGAKVV